MTRISEFITVSFKPRSLKEIVPEMVEKIDEEIRQSYINHSAVIERLQSRKKDLLLLTYEEPTEPLTAPSNEDDDIPF